MNSDTEIKIRLLRGVSESVQEFYRGSVVTEGSELIVELIRLFTTDLQRRVDQKTATIDYLARNLKRGVRLAGQLVQKVSESEAESLSGWFYGCPPANTVQRFQNLFWEAAVEMTRSILEIEAEWPELKPYFDWERQNYAQKNSLIAEI